MVKINKPPRIYGAQMLLKYEGRNKAHEQKKSYTAIKIKEFDENTGEQLVVQHIMFDGTELLFCMISANLYLKKDGTFQLLEGQNYCDFELFINDNLLVFSGEIGSETIFNEDYNFRERFDVTIIMENNEQILDTWILHNKEIHPPSFY